MRLPFGFERNKSKRSLLTLTAIAILVAVLGVLHAVLPARVHDAFGICGGYSLKLLDELPVGVIQAARIYFKDYRPVEFVGNVSAVDPIRESTVPHRCVRVPDNRNPENPRAIYQDKGDISALAAKQRRYSGVIPPGASKALMVDVTLYKPKPLTYTGKDPAQIAAAKYLAYTFADFIVAYYPKRGWIGVFDHSGVGNYFHH